MSVSSALPTHRPAVMVVDDEPLLRALVRRMLEPAGYQVHEASDGLEALETLARLGGVDVVVTDLQMPNMDGVALANYLAGQAPPIPTLLISGFDRQPDKVTLLAPLLPKPFTHEQLLASVQQVLSPETPRIRRA